MTKPDIPIDAPTPASRVRRGRVRVIAVVSAATAVATAIGVAVADASDRPAAVRAVQVAPAPVALPAGITRQKLTWTDCPATGDDRESESESESESDAAPTPGPAMTCATVRVPLDYRRPAGRTIDVAISRIASSAPGKRRGIMLLNPGGPGYGGLDMPVLMRDELPKSVAEQYDLVGFDPRGVGASSPVTCDLTDEQAAVPAAYKPATFARDVEAARQVAAKCAKHADVLAHITTANTARDMDVIRSVLGERKLSFFGYSYGTYLGPVYLQLFPGNADRMVFDSAVDPALAWRGTLQAWAVGSKPAFERFTAYAARNDAIYHLGRTADAVAKTFWDLVAKADVTPIERKDGDFIRWRFRLLSFFRVDAATELARLKEVSEGGGPEPSPAGKAHDDGLGRSPFAEPSPDNMTAARLSVFCNEKDWPRDPQQYARDAVRDKKRYPLAGDTMSNIMACAFWSVPRTEPEMTVGNRSAALVVQNEWDPQTPSFSGRGLHRALTGSRMVFVAEGEGHTVYHKDGNSCAYAAVNAYLSTGRLPARDVTCKAAAPEPGRATDGVDPAESAPRRTS